MFRKFIKQLLRPIVVALVNEEMAQSRYDQEQAAALMRGVMQDELIKVIQALSKQ